MKWIWKCKAENIVWALKLQRPGVRPVLPWSLHDLGFVG